MKDLKKYPLSLILIIASYAANAQNGATSITLPWGIRDTILMPVVNYNGEFLPYRELDNVYISKLSPEQLAETIAAYNRLRNAVYATYGYARAAGYTLNDVASNLEGKSKSQRKAYIKSREKELKKEFSDPLTNLSVYQGKVLMKLINRQTGNNCYDIIKEYRGSLNARMYQTVAFFFGSSLRQDYDNVHDPTDRQIENIVKEIDGVWYNNPSRPMVSNSR
jgi:benzoyl-CoA reductase/2-hydroxyglutaryl-CoA dehydratase subunit BcrC/BadD/HgdB